MAVTRPEASRDAPAARETPYGTVPAPVTMDRGVTVVHLTAAPARWRIDAGHVVEGWAYDGQVPGPPIRVEAGDRVRIVLENRLPVPTALAWGGLAPLLGRRGLPTRWGDPVAPGERGAYEFTARRPGLATYHPRADAAEGRRRGLLGALVVDPPGGPEPGVVEALQILSEADGRYLVNGRCFPDTDAYEVPVGRRVRIRAVNLGRHHHAMRLSPGAFEVVRVDGRRVPAGARFPRDTQSIAPGEAVDLEFTPAEAGTWLFHCHVPPRARRPDSAEAGLITAVTAV